MLSPDLLDAIAKAGSALALIEFYVIVRLLSEARELRERVERLHELRLAEAMKIVAVLEPTKEQNELLADVAVELSKRRKP